MNRTVKIEVHIPNSRVAFLKKKMKHRSVSLLLVKAATRVLVIRKTACKVVASFQCRFNHRPRKKLNTNSAFTIDIGNLLYEVPEPSISHSL